MVSFSLSLQLLYAAVETSNMRKTLILASPLFLLYPAEPHVSPLSIPTCVYSYLNGDRDIHCKLSCLLKKKRPTNPLQAIQALLLGLAFGVTCMRCWIRVRLEERGLTLVDWLVWGGWLCALGWFSCSTKALYILIDHPLDEETRSDSVDYLKVRAKYQVIGREKN